LGIRRWNARRDLLEGASRQDEIAERALASVAELARAEQKIKSEGRHPDDWMSEYEHTAALWIAAEREHATRRELAIKSARLAERVGPERDVEAATREHAAERPDALERADALADARGL